MRLTILMLCLLARTLVFSQYDDDYIDDYSWDSASVDCYDYYHFPNPLKIEQVFTDRSTLKHIKDSGVRELRKSWMKGDTDILEVIYFDTLGRVDSIVNHDGYPYSRRVTFYKYDDLDRLYYWESLTYHESGVLGFKEALHFSIDKEVEKSFFWLVNLSDFDDVRDIVDTLSTVFYDTTIGDLRRFVKEDTFDSKYYYWFQNDKLILQGTDDFYKQANIEENETGYSIHFFRTKNDTTTLIGYEQYDDFGQVMVRKGGNLRNNQGLVVLEENRYDGFQRLITHAIFCDDEQVKTYIRDAQSGVILKEIVKDLTYGEYEISYTYY